MAGTIITSTIQGTTLTDGTNSTSTTNCIQGSAKAWGSYAYVANGSSPTLRKAYNISSITRNSTGNYTFSFTNALADANYGVSMTGNEGSTVYAPNGCPIAKSTSSFTVAMGYGGSFTAYDYGVDFAVFD